MDICDCALAIAMNLRNRFFFVVDDYDSCRREVSGYSYGSKPLPGFTGFDCSRFRCPTGDSYVASSNTAVTRVEVQKVLCQWDASRFPGDDDGLGSDSAEFFTLRLRPTERASLKIAVNATSREIAEAISFLPSVGNVSVAFFDLRNNNSNIEQYRACSSAFNESYGGFLVRFETEAGVSAYKFHQYLWVIWVAFFVICDSK